MNQTLEGHTGGVVCVTWNPLFRKLVRIWHCVVWFCVLLEGGLFLNWVKGFSYGADKRFNNFETLIIVSMFYDNC